MKKEKTELKLVWFIREEEESVHAVGVVENDLPPAEELIADEEIRYPFIFEIAPDQN